VKTAVSIPDDVFEKAEALAARLGKNRSELVTDALREHLIRHGDTAITARLNAVYDDTSIHADSANLDAYAREIAQNNPW
jgi:metal-responsive CopG/Arc/MetJ family transcriptional regulator